MKNQFFLLPSFFTTMNLFCGLFSITAGIEGAFVQAALAIFVAGFFDGIDGRVARFTGTTSRFGMEYDSLCDLVSFGVAPAMLAYNWVLHDLGRFGLLAIFLYSATTALRLARFNIADSRSMKKSFVGLPSPAAAYMVAATFFFVEFIQVEPPLIGRLMAVMMYFISYLMVSTHRYASFKQPESGSAKTFQAFVAMVLLIVVLATEPRVTLFFLGCIYLISGPFGGLYRLQMKRKIRLEESRN